MKKPNLTKKQMRDLYNKAITGTSSDIPVGEIWIVDEKNFRFRSPRNYPKYIFRLFGRKIRIYIDKV